MKTALIKTDFWKDDDIFCLTPDVRMFYLCLLTNPERNTTRAFKCSDRLLSAYTGYNDDTIKLCRKSLIEAGFIQYIDGFYILREENNVEPKRGKLTQSIQEKFMDSLPENVLKVLLNETPPTPAKSSSVALEESLEYVYVNVDVDKDVDKDVNNNKDVNKELLKEFRELNEYWAGKSGRKLSDNKTSRDAYRKLRKEHSVDDIRLAINGASYFHGMKYKPQVMSFAALYQKWDNLTGHMTAYQKEQTNSMEVF